MKTKTLFSLLALLAIPLTSAAIDLGGAAATDVSNWTTNNDIYLQGTTDGFTLNWENVITNTATANNTNNNFDLTFETNTNYTLAHLFLFNESIDLATLPNGIETLSWLANFEATSRSNWIPVIAITDTGTTTFYRSNLGGNPWNGNGLLSFTSGPADNNAWIALSGDPQITIDATRTPGVIPNLQATTGLVQFGFLQWDSSAAGIISPAINFTTAIDQFDISINQLPEGPTEVRDSSNFPTNYIANQIFDGSSLINGWTTAGGTTPVTTTLNPSGTILTVTNNDNNGWIQQDSGTSPWEIGVATGGSFTVEVRLKMTDDPGNGFGIWAANGNIRASLQVNSDSTQVLQRDLLATHDNTDDFHVFRIVYHAPSNLVYFWRDGVSLTPDESGFTPDTVAPQNRLILGDCCSSYLMTSVEIDYVRYDTTGGFVPPTPSLPAIKSITYNETSNTITLTWNSTPGSLYSIDESADLSDWSIEVDDSIDAQPGSDQTSASFPGPAPGTPDRFYRVRRTE